MCLTADYLVVWGSAEDVGHAHGWEGGSATLLVKVRLSDFTVESISPIGTDWGGYRWLYYDEGTNTLFAGYCVNSDGSHVLAYVDRYDFDTLTPATRGTHGNEFT